MDYFVIEKTVSEFQKLLNQWKHKYFIEIIWVFYSNEQRKIIAIIKRDSNCPHGTFGGREHCIKCREVDKVG